MNVGLLASEAAQAFLAAAGLTTVTHFYAEIEDPSSADYSTQNLRSRPCVVCFFNDAKEFPFGTGNYGGELNFRVEGSADDLLVSEFAAIFEEVWGKVYTTTILADLSAAKAGFTALAITDGVRQTAQVIEGRIRTKGLVLPINCCAKDIS